MQHTQAQAFTMRNSVLLILTAHLSLACNNTSPSCDDLVIDASLHPNSAKVSWVTPEESTVSVAYLMEGQVINRVISSEGATEHEGGLHGLFALRDITYTATALPTDGGDPISCKGEFTTANLAPEVPELVVEIFDPERSSPERYFAGVAIGSDTSLPFVISRSGQIVWYSLSESFHYIDQVEVGLDGDGMLVGSYDILREADLGVVHRVDLFGEVTDELPLTGGHHFFRQTDEESILHPSIEVRPWENSDGEIIDVVGDALLEISTDGTTREIFNAWEQLEPSEHSNFYNQFFPQGADWTHLNSIDLFEGNLLITLPHLRTVLLLDPETGSIIEEFSTENYSFDDLPFSKPHDVHMLDKNTITAINHYTNTTIAVEYSIDREAGILTPIWRYDGGISSNYMGQFSRLSNGNRLINYGAAGVIQEVTPEGEVVWELQTPLGYWFGNGQMVESIYDAAQ